MDVLGITFLRPAWLIALLLVPWLALALVRLAARRGGWSQYVAPALQRYVLRGTDRTSRQHLFFLVVLVALALGALAMAGPSWQSKQQPLQRGGNPMVVALDLSRSMNVADLAPSRLARAKIKLFELLEQRAGQETALVVFSSNAFTVVPLTDDNATIAALVNSLSTDIMPSRGSYPAAAIDKARDLLTQAGLSTGQVLLITDGGYSEAAGQAAARLRTAGFSLSVLGVGTKDGGPVPAVEGGFETDRDGRVAVVQLAEADLARLASTGGGRYVRIRVDDRDLAALMEVPIAGGGTERSGQSLEVRADGGVWLLLALLPLAALSFRRGWVFCLCLGVFAFGAPPAMAFSFADLWLTPDQQAARELARGNYARAADQFVDPAWAAAAAYRDGQYTRSAEALTGVDSVRDHYNRGNALARAGQFDAAIAAYDEVLQRDPSHADAEYNRQLLLDAQQQQQEQEQQGDSEQQNDAGDSADGAESSAESQDGEGEQQGSEQQADAGSESADGEPGDNQDPSDERGQQQQDVEALQKELEAARAEAGDDETAEPAQAQPMSAEARQQQELEESMEQWLRRIEDDPGGLLRRKFLRQYRLQGRDQDGRSLWPDDEVEPW